MTNNSHVLIVGAGPTGLAAALVLSKLGVKVRIIDKNKHRSDKSKALGVQAGTLECLRRAISEELVNEMLKAGRPAREAWIHINDIEPIRVDLGSIKSDYNFILVLAQSETERILEEHLNKNSVFVERETEFLSLKENEFFVSSQVKLPTGEFQDVQSSYVIGCDGSHSTVRSVLGLPFDGGSYRGDFILGDVKLDWPWSYDSIRTFVSERGVIASFPMRGQQMYRLILIPKVASINPSREITLDEFKAVTLQLSKNQIRVLETSWLTRFSVHHRIVKYFKKGRVFLAGDGAHIHSPAGGQGMNTGIQDALNLGLKLKQVLLDQDSPKILELYEKERLPVARQVLRGTDFVFKLGLRPESKILSWARENILPKLVRTPFIQHKVVSAISEVAVARKEIKRYR